MTTCWQLVSRELFEIFSASHFRVGLKWQNHVIIDDRFKRPADAADLLGNPTKARTQLGRSPSLTFEQLIHLMVDEDLRNLQIPQMPLRRAA